MTVTARKHALQNRILPKVRHLAGLYILELAVILSWTFLLATVFNFISGSWFILLPLSYFISVIMLAWLERSRTNTRGQCPLEAFGLAEISLNGSRPSEWQTLRRLLMTPPLLLILCIGLIPAPQTGKTILQMISGTRIVPLDANMDPRPDKEIFGWRRKALMKIVSYTMLSLMVAAVIILVPPELSRGGAGGRIDSIRSLPSNERELLASYLEMKAMYPDSLEFHVRLASLYYRNNMEEDLWIELEQIRRLDPDHSILMLEEDLSVSMEDLIVEQDSAFADSVPGAVTEEAEPPDEEETELPAEEEAELPAEEEAELPAEEETELPAEEETELPAEEATVAEDSATLQPDSVLHDLSIEASDSIALPVYSTSTADSMEIDDVVEADSLMLPAAEDSIPETVPPDYSPDDAIPEATPDTIVTEETSTDESMDSIESPGDTEYIEPSESIEETQPPDPQPESEPEGT